jgi:hypothetical protein
MVSLKLSTAAFDRSYGKSMPPQVQYIEAVSLELPGGLTINSSLADQSHGV